jgi:ABC-type lipoprotein release transport system permease subunit
MILSFALKNILRNKTRSFIVILAMTLGMIGGILSGAVLVGASSQSLQDAADNYASEIQIRNPLFGKDNDINFYIEKASDRLAFIKSIPEVNAACSRIIIFGMINSPANSTGAFINAIDPENEKKVTRIYERIADSCGTYFNCDKKYPVVISQKMADKLKVKLNSKIVLSFMQPDTSYTAGAFRVCGIYKTTNSGFDAANLFIRKSDLDKIASLPEDIAHIFAIRVPDDKNLISVKQILQTAFPELEVQTWKELNPELALYDDFMDKMIYLFLIIILLALGFGIVNTMLMAVLERIKEFGMLMAIGMSKRMIFKLIMSESVILSSIGGATGMIISALILKFWSKNGIHFDNLKEGFEKFGFASHIYPHLEPNFYFILSALIILTGILACIYPARKAIKLNPVEALRTDN